MCRVAAKRTETMKIIASCSRDISLQATVRSGFPVGTNSKPGGGSFFVVTYCLVSTMSRVRAASNYLELKLLLFLRVVNGFEIRLMLDLRWLLQGIQL